MWSTNLDLGRAECCRRVARRITRTVFSALSGMRLLACLIVAPRQGYDEPGFPSYTIRPFCPTSADGLHSSPAVDVVMEMPIKITSLSWHPPQKTAHRQRSKEFYDP